VVREDSGRVREGMIEWRSSSQTIVAGDAPQNEEDNFFMGKFIIKIIYNKYYKNSLHLL